MHACTEEKQDVAVLRGVASNKPGVTHFHLRLDPGELELSNNGPFLLHNTRYGDSFACYSRIIFSGANSLMCERYTYTRARGHTHTRASTVTHGLRGVVAVYKKKATTKVGDMPALCICVGIHASFCIRTVHVF